MPKGFFTQSAVVLLERPLSLEAVFACLESMKPQMKNSGTSGWMGGAAVVVPMRLEVKGNVVVDLISEPWPDGMGNPQEEPELFGAWTMGWFGPFVFPGCLARALQMSFSWDEADATVEKHRAFLRIKSSYVLGAGGDSPVMPSDYDALAELEFITSVTRRLLTLPGALAYFNPNGEVLRSPDGFSSDLDWHRDQQLLPLPVWSSVRLFHLDSEWVLMDTVGMEQLDVQDHEACFLKEAYDPAEVDNFLRNSTNYVLEKGPIIKDGDTINGPGDVRWKARTIPESITERPRQILRWTPVDGSSLPEQLGNP